MEFCASSSSAVFILDMDSGELKSKYTPMRNPVIKAEAPVIAMEKIPNWINKEDRAGSYKIFYPGLYHVLFDVRFEFV